MELYLLFSIVDRTKAKEMLKLHHDLNLSFVITNLGFGTATSEHLSLHDLEPSEKAIICTVASSDSLKKLIKLATCEMFIDIPGNGIMMASPIKSIGGGKTLEYLTDSQTLGGAQPDMNFEHELIIVILNEGYADTVMETARAAGATGGTMTHAKGMGKTESEKFFGVSLAEEKDMLYILSDADKKSNIMKAITKYCGAETPSGAICFSLPISKVAGLRKPFAE